MAIDNMNDGVGKKIVEALKMQSAGAPNGDVVISEEPQEAENTPETVYDDFSETSTAGEDTSFGAEQYSTQQASSIYNSQFEDAGMLTTGVNPETGLTEIIEIPSHKWFVGTQFHPEYKSTVTNPHPLFVAFVKACLS